MEIPKAPIERIIRKSGAERVSNEAVEALVEYLEDIAIKASRLAITVSRHAGRKTVQYEDIKLAEKEMVKK
ncbi:MAG: histone family protein [Candidatus ainarchaeum sp.]|nr:histone family protein [Candidatus ainarchaeum sp.]